MIAQGKAAEAAALGKEPPHQSLFLFRFGAPQARQTGREKEGIILRPQPRAALRLPWAIIVSSLPGLQLGWPAHIFGELFIKDENFPAKFVMVDKLGMNS